MPHEVIMPALGMAQDTGQLVAWLKKPGDPVKVGEPIMEVETDKATMEVEAQADGYLTDLRAAEGADVPVGDVVALISETADGGGASAVNGGATKAPQPATAASDAAGALPDGAQVIMPALGMAQDTGLIVGWCVAPGDRVGADDPLLEVETDKSTMEVPAGADGYLAAVLAAEGEDVPVGEVIAIVSTEKPTAPVVRARADGPAAPAPVAPAAVADAPDTPEAIVATPTPAPAKAPTADPGGRILASPKARRLATEEGLDFSRLVAEGVAQPFHVADLDTLRTLPDAAPASAPQAAAAPAQRLTATVPGEALTAFLDWVTAETGAPITRARALAGFAAASLRDGNAPLAIVAETGLTGLRETFADPDLAPMTAPATAGEDALPALILRDLIGTAITSVQLGTATAPVLSLSQEGATLTITYEGALPADRAIALINGFAGRLTDPLRHLL